MHNAVEQCSLRTNPNLQLETMKNIIEEPPCIKKVELTKRSKIDKFKKWDYVILFKMFTST